MKLGVREYDVLAAMTDKPMSAQDFARMCSDNRLVRRLMSKGLVELNHIPATQVALSDKGRAALNIQHGEGE
jgi:hypothetical protein